jgi:hypothetical protein
MMRGARFTELEVVELELRAGDRGYFQQWEAEHQLWILAGERVTGR